MYVRLLCTFLKKHFYNPVFELFLYNMDLDAFRSKADIFSRERSKLIEYRCASAITTILKNSLHCQRANKTWPHSANNVIDAAQKRTCRKR